MIRYRLLSVLLLGIPACQPSGAQADKPHPPAASAPAQPVPPAANETDKGKAMQELAKIDWTMKLVNGGKSLRIEYQVKSLSPSKIYLSDLLPIAADGKFTLRFNPIIVMNDKEPDTVRFVRGRVSTSSPQPRLQDPGARALEPGGTLSGSAEVALPLRAAHYRGTMEALKGTPTSAVLELGYISGDAHWSELPLDDGTKLTMSHPSDKMQFLRSDRKPIPKS